MKLRMLGGLAIVAAVIVMSAATVQAQEEYRTEVSASYLYGDFGDTWLYAYGAAGELFFAPVKTAEHAYAEAAFLERAGSVMVFAQNQVAHEATDKSEGPGVGVALNFAKAGFPLAIGASYSQTWLDSADSAGTAFEAKNYSLSVGNYFTDTLLAGVSYSYNDYEFSTPGFPDSSSEEQAYGVFARYSLELQDGASMGLEGEGQLLRMDDGTETLQNTELALAADYYFTRSFSAGVGLSANTGEEAANEGMTYNGRLQYFFTPLFSLRVDGQRSIHANDGYANSKVVSSTLAMRF